MTAGESGVRVSEVLAGPGGFVELANESSRLIDLTGWILKDGVRSFTLPEGTRIAAHTEAIFPNEITGLGSGALVSLYFGNMRLADSAPILDSSGALSSQRVGESWFLMSATPGIVTPASRAAVSKPTAAINPVRAEKVSPEVIEADPTLETAEVGRGAPPQRSWPLFLGISLFIGGLGAGGAVFTRRALS
jgi:hypothetical protein